MINPATITPKEKFMLSSVRVSDHKSLIAMDNFEFALNTALLEYQQRLTASITTTNDALAVAYRIQGAQDLASLFKTLAESVTPAKPRVNLNLDPKA